MGILLNQVHPNLNRGNDERSCPRERAELNQSLKESQTDNYTQRYPPIEAISIVANVVPFIAWYSIGISYSTNPDRPVIMCVKSVRCAVTIANWSQTTRRRSRLQSLRVSLLDLVV